MNGHLTVKTFEEWRSEKASRQNSTNKEAKRRYEDYLLSVAVGGPNYEKRRSRYRNGENRASNTRPEGSSHGYRKTMGSMSECTKDYALALMDPWALDKPGCIPDLIVLPSYKFGCRAKGTFTVGANGVGYVGVNYNAVANGIVSGVLQFYAGVATDSSYTGIGFQPGIGPGRNPFTNDSTLDYQKLRGVNINETRPYDFRLVGCGLKTRAIGPEFTRGGRMLAFREPEGRNIIASQTANQLLLNRETVTVPVDRIEHFCTYRPSNPDQLGYRNTSALGDVQLLMLVEGATPGYTFEYDVIWWFETIGSSLPMLSASHSDPLGMAVVQQALPSTQPTHSPGAQFKEFVSNMVEVASTVMSFIGPLI